MKQNLRLGTISGIPIGLNWGLLAIAGVYLVMLATNILPDAAPGAGAPLYWLTAGVGVFLFFLSILLHELGHSLVAQRHGLEVSAITLWLMGGVAQVKGQPKTPGSLFKIAFAGPAVNVVLGGVFYGAAALLEATVGATVLGTLLVWLAVINVVLAVFNLVPASPLDGGRILAAILWKVRKDKYAGQRTAAVSGTILGSFMLFFGIMGLLSGGGGLWFLVLGLFLRQASRSELTVSRIHEATQDKVAADIMSPIGRAVNGAVTLEGLAIMSGGQPPAAYPVLGAAGRPIGLVTTAMMRNISSRNADSPVELEAIGWEEFVSAWNTEPVNDVMDRMTEAACIHAIINDQDSEQVGYIGMENLHATALPKPKEPVPA